MACGCCRHHQDHQSPGQQASGHGALDRGLLAQMLAGRGLSAATVAIDPGMFRGVLPLPASVFRENSIYAAAYPRRLRCPPR
jgi:hypothetical protein